MRTTKRRTLAALILINSLVLSACLGPGLAVPSANVGGNSEILVVTGGTPPQPTDQPPIVQTATGYAPRAIVEFQRAPSAVQVFNGPTY